MIVDDTNLKNGTFFNRNNIWPACLPKKESEYVLSNGKPIKGYTAGNLFLRVEVLLYLPKNSETL